MNTSTKQEILEEGIAQFRRHGYHGTSIQMVLSACDVPKGSFYYYFNSKEDFALAAVDRYAEIYMNLLKEIRHQSLPPMEKITTFFGRLIAFYKAEGYKLTCLMSILSVDVGSDIPAIRGRIDSHFRAMKSELAAIILQAQKRNSLPGRGRVEALSLAEFLINSFNGALISMKCQQSDRPLVDFQTTAAKLIAS